jgi:hypothetical protein
MANSEAPRYFLRNRKPLLPPESPKNSEPAQDLEHPQSSEAAHNPEEPLQRPRPLLPPPAPGSENHHYRFKFSDDLITYPVDFVTWPESLVSIRCPPWIEKSTGPQRAAGALPDSIDGPSDLAMFHVQNLVFSLCDMERKDKDRNLSLLVTTTRPFMPLSARKAPTFNDGDISRLCQGLSSASWGQRNISVLGRLAVADQSWSQAERVQNVSETPILVLADLDKPGRNVLLAVPEDYEAAWDDIKRGGPHEPHHRFRGGFPQRDRYLFNPQGRAWGQEAADRIRDVAAARGLPGARMRRLMDDACFSDLGPDIKGQPELYYSIVDLGPYGRLPVNRRLREGEYKTWVKLIRPYPLEEKWRLMFVNINTLPEAFQAVSITSHHPSLLLESCISSASKLMALFNLV